MTRVADELGPHPDGPDVRWGVLATGRIADEFAADLALAPGHTLAAVGSRRKESADAFAATHGAQRSHASYAGVVDDPEVNVVYVATPHHRHAEDVTACLEAGKPVLCEKPLTLDATSAERVVALARERGVFLAEAMWMRTMPTIRRVAELVREGAIGTVTSVRADLSFVGRADVARLWDADLGASALLDVGVYPFTLAQLLLGEPSTIAAAGTLDPSGSFDVNGAAALTYPGGAVASLSWSQVGWSDNRATVAGTEGTIEIDRRFHHPDAFTLRTDVGDERVDAPRTGKGFVHEILEVGACLAAGRTESELLPLDGSLAVLRQLDDAAAQLHATGAAAVSD